MSERTPYTPVAELLQEMHDRLNALTRERDEAVRERDELRAKVDLADEMSAQITRDGEASGGIPWAWYMRWRTNYDSLTTDKAAQEIKDGEG